MDGLELYNGNPVLTHALDRDVLLRCEGLLSGVLPRHPKRATGRAVGSLYDVLLNEQVVDLMDILGAPSRHAPRCPA